MITANGDMTSQTAWKIIAKNVAGATKTFACQQVYLREYDISKPNEGKVSIDIFVRITGTWTTNLYLVR